MGMADEDAPGDVPASADAVAEERSSVGRVKQYAHQMLGWLTEEQDGVVFARWMFLRLLAIISFVAFLSFHVQMVGLIGEDGILPADDFLGEVERQLGGDAFLQVPTLAWFASGDAGLQVMTLGGMAAAVLLFFNVAPALMLFILWMLYLSLMVVGQIFTAYQWDILLIEVLFLSIFLAPEHIRPSRGETAPSRFPHLMLRIVLFKLLFLSGLAKLASRDFPFNAPQTLQAYFETQPLPAPPAWYLHQIPPEVHVASAGLLLLAELAVPFLLFVPRRRVRMGAATTVIGYQLLIMATGNYNFMNILTITLALLVLDDRVLGRIRDGLPRLITPVQRGIRSPKLVRYAEAVPLIVVLLLNMAVIGQAALGQADVPSPVQQATSSIAPFRTINTYGMFGFVSQDRPEVVIQGSMDGDTWEEYDFRYKPGNTSDPLPLVQPHQPRLDWQMWFAALNAPGYDQWFIDFVRQLLEGEEQVERLLERDPFGNETPTYVRAVLYRYDFTGFAAGNERIWNRSRERLYLPPVRLAPE